jgi:hypothetical protein
MKRAPAHARKASGLAVILLGFGLGLVLAFSTPAAAQVDCSNPGHAGVPECATTTTGDPGTTTTTRVPAPAAPDPAPPTRTPTSGGLAFTGGDVAGLAVIGTGVVAAGIALVLVGRRQRAHREPTA